MTDKGTFFNGQSGCGAKRSAPKPSKPTTLTVDIPMPEYTVRQGVKFYNSKPNIPLPADYQWEKVPSLGWFPDKRKNDFIQHMWDTVVDSRGFMIDKVFEKVPGAGWVVRKMDEALLTSDRFKAGRSTNTETPSVFIYDPKTQKPVVVEPRGQTKPEEKEREEGEPKEGGGKKKRGKPKKRPPRVFVDSKGYYIVMKKKKVYLANKKKLNKASLKKKVVNQLSIEDIANQRKSKRAKTKFRIRRVDKEKKAKAQIDNLTNKIVALKQKVSDTDKQIVSSNVEDPDRATRFAMLNLQDQQEKDRKLMEKLIKERLLIMARQRVEEREQELADRQRAELFQRMREDRERQRQLEHEQKMIQFIQYERKHPMLTEQERQPPRPEPEDDVVSEVESFMRPLSSSSSDVTMRDRAGNRVVIDIQPKDDDDDDDNQNQARLAPEERKQRMFQDTNDTDGTVRYSWIDSANQELAEQEEMIKFNTLMRGREEKLANNISPTPSEDRAFIESFRQAEAKQNESGSSLNTTDKEYALKRFNELMNEENPSSATPSTVSRSDNDYMNYDDRDLLTHYNLLAQQGFGRKGIGLTDAQIDKIMVRYPEYTGCFSRDEIHMLPKEDYQAFIMNTDTSKGSGIHWVGVVINATNQAPDQYSIMYYDSFGDEPPSNFAKDIHKFVEGSLKPNRYLKYKVNNIVHQDASEDTCGIHATEFLKHILKGKSFKEATGFNELDGLDQVKEKEPNAQKKMKEFRGLGKFGYI